MPLSVTNPESLPVETMASADNGRAGSRNALDAAQPFDLGVVVGDPARLPDVDVCRRAQDTVAQLGLQPGHQCQGNNQGQDANRHANRGEQRHARDRRVLTAREEVSEGNKQLK